MSASSGGIGGDGHETVTTAAAGGSSPVTYTERSQPAAKTAATVPSGFRASVHDAQSLAAIAGPDRDDLRRQASREHLVTILSEVSDDGSKAALGPQPRPPATPDAG